MRLLRPRGSAAALIAALVALAGAQGCGPNQRLVYEGEGEFERCLALDRDQNAPNEERLQCWSDWEQSYTTGQAPERIQHARNRIAALSGRDGNSSGGQQPPQNGPSQGGPLGYPGQPPQGFAQNYPQQPGYPPQNPPQQPGYPPQNPPQQPGYPPQNPPQQPPPFADPQGGPGGGANGVFVGGGNNGPQPQQPQPQGPSGSNPANQAAPPGTSCSSQCRETWGACSGRCGANSPACVAACDDSYRDCMRACY